ncbi:ABC transporter permease subunit [Leucothrix mucor]|uniref:ABC transporter permease subunit n=1 Tax=Leucothrix mucor TaxID=45248 RepID=UPI0003B30FE8|nr:ABC transporter permease subunit [Leucothrix mucor]
MKADFNWGRFFLIGIPLLWLLLFFLTPFLIVLKISLSDMATAMPPYAPAYEAGSGLLGIWAMIQAMDFENFIWLLDDNIYWLSYLSSLKIAFFSTIFTLLLGYPIAYGLARSPEKWRGFLVLLVILPFWTSFLIRVYAWIGILKSEGFLNHFLLWLGVIDDPLALINTNFAVYIGIVYSYLPFMVLPLYAALEKMDDSLVEAALDLGTTRIGAFWQVTFPLSMAGVIAGCFLVFIPAMGEFVIPDLLGGSETLMIGKTLWGEFFSNRDWPVASAVAIVLLLLLVVPILLFQRQQEKAQEAAS